MPEKAHARNLPDPLVMSDRLLVRRPEEADLPHLEHVFGDPRMMHYLGETWTPHQIAKALADWHDDWGTGHRWHGILIHRPTSTLIGTAGCSEDTVAGEPGLEVSWFVLPAFQRQGFATEITTEILRFGFADVGVARALAETHPKNPASNGILKRLGFSSLGERTHSYSDLPGFDRQILWELTIERWRELRNGAIPPEHVQD